MRIVALDAAQPLPFIHRQPPRTGLAAMDSALPVAVDRTVALGAQQYYVLLGDLRAVVVDESVPVGGMVAVETKAVGAVPEDQFAMLYQGPVMMPARLEHAVAFHAVVLPTEAPQAPPSTGRKRAE